MNNVRAKKRKRYLVFIDTNVYLDFYCEHSKYLEKSMIKHINANHELIITTDQVFMEYKKRRQKIMMDSLAKIKSPDWKVYSVPTFLNDAKPAKIIEKSRREIKKQISKLALRVKSILQNPKNDIVYQCVQRIFKNTKRPWHLSNKNPLHRKIESNARKRFLRGCPPRKDKDTAIGDAINWEWILHCANASDCNIVIVTRDYDYGISVGNELILNSWLEHEFKEKVSRQKKIVLTNKLSTAFELAGITITQKEKKQEEETVSAINEEKYGEIRSYFDQIDNLFKNPEFRKSLFSNIPSWNKIHRITRDKADLDDEENEQ